MFLLTSHSPPQVAPFVRRWLSALAGGDDGTAGECRSAVRLVLRMLREEEEEGSDWFARGTGAQTLAGASGSGQGPSERRARAEVAMKALLDALV